MSKTVEGSEGKINSQQTASARVDLKEKGDVPSYDAHTHPNEKDKDGNFTSIGAPTPSEADKKGSQTTPNLVLGYTQTVTPPPSGTIGGSSTVQTNRTVGFYNSGGSIITIKFDDFKNTIKRINKN
jgi:hypothetical protein